MSLSQLMRNSHTHYSAREGATNFQKELLFYGFIRQGQNDEDTVGLFRLEVTLVENPWWLQVIIVIIMIVIIIIIDVIDSKNNCITFMLNFPGWLCPDPR